jgi:hypothetical protein
MTETEWGAVAAPAMCWAHILTTAAEYFDRRAEMRGTMGRRADSRWHAGQPRCPACWGIAPEDGGRGHDDDCTLATAIREATGG